MRETKQNDPIYFNGCFGEDESMEKNAKTISKEKSSIETFDFDKHRHLLCGNPYSVCLKEKV